MCQEDKEIIKIYETKLKALHRRCQKAEGELAKLKAKGTKYHVDRDYLKKIKENEEMMETVGKVK